MTDSRDLDQVRADIDAIDQEIQALISRRAECAQRVADIKMAEVQAARERGEADTEVVFYRPEREAQVLTRIIERSSFTYSSRRCEYLIRPPACASASGFFPAARSFLRISRSGA